MSEVSDLLSGLSPEKRELLALLMEEESKENSMRKIIPVVRTTNRFPLSYSQKRLWFLDEFEPDTPLYNLSLAVRLIGPFSPQVLQKSIDQIVKRHESLRTTFHSVDGTPIQEVASEIRIAIDEYVVQPSASNDLDKDALEIASQVVAKPFLLDQGPLFRVTVIKLADDNHIILLTMHHIISDGWSMGVLIEELMSLYEVYANGNELDLQPLPIQYPDYAIWQEEYLRGEVFSEQLSYWEKELKDGNFLLEMPVDFPRPSQQRYQGDEYTFFIPEETTQKLKELSQREGVTLFMTLLAAFYLILYRYSGQSDLNIGTPIANRNRAETERLIGLFINTLVLRAKLSGSFTFLELLKQIQRTTLGAYEHQDLPFEILVDKLQPERDMSYSPIFQVMFVFQNAPMNRRNMADASMEVINFHNGVSEFDMTLVMSEGPKRLIGSIEFNTDLYKPETIILFAEHLSVLLANIVENPEQSIDLIPIMSSIEKNKIIHDWNETQVPLPKELFVHKLFERQVLDTPDAIAVEQRIGENHNTLTYSELDKKASILAKHLREKMVGPGNIIGVYMERSTDVIVALLGILKTGSAYLPLDPTYPDERLHFMIEDSGIKYVVTQSNLENRLHAINLHPIFIDIGMEKTDTASENWFISDDEPVISPSDSAYIIYTSGSTGQPKGVMVSHQAVVNHNLAMVKAFDLTPSDRVLQFSTINFDASIEEIFPALISGSTVVIPPKESLTMGLLLLSGAQFSELVISENITVVDFATSYWHQWVHDLTISGSKLPDNIRLVVIGGEKAQRDRLEQWKKLNIKPIRLLNTYGPTEATIVATIYESDDRLDPRCDLPIGTPIQNLQAYVLDQYLNPTPIGVPGELCIGGIGVAKGYLNRDELTREKFILDQHIAGNRIYKTGDRVRWLDSGVLEFYGRGDEQIKVRGFRVELGEIEIKLREHPSVRDAVILADRGGRDRASGVQRLAAFIVLEAEQSLYETDLRNYLRTRLPEYMLPAIYVFLDELPLSPSGKVDRKKLSIPETITHETEEKYIPPRTPEEEILVSIWEDLLGIQHIGVEDNFFELGGHSLVVTQLVSRIRRYFDVDLPVRRIFEQPTISKLSESITLAKKEAFGIEKPIIAPATQQAELVLSFAQQRLWFLEQLQPGTPYYNIPSAVRIEGVLDLKLLETSINTIIKRHDVLRMNVLNTDGRPVVQISEDLNLKFTLFDLSQLEPLHREKEAQRLTNEEAQEPFHLEVGELLRLTIVKLEQTLHLVLLTMHHIISDGWSSGIFFNELSIIYTSLLSGEDYDLDPLLVQYFDYSAWQRNWLSGETLDKEIGFWEKNLTGAPPLIELPLDKPRPASPSGKGDYITFGIPYETAALIKAFARSEGVTSFMLLLGLFDVLLYRYSGLTDICVGTPVANRTIDEIENLIGFFANTLVIRVGIDPYLNFKELVHKVRQVSMEAYSHTEVPFEMVVDAVQPERNLSHSPLFQVMFSMLKADQKGSDLPGVDLKLSPVEIHSGTAKFDLTLFFVEDEEGFKGAFEYNTDIFHRQTIERMVEHLLSLLADALKNPELEIAKLKFVSESERQILLHEWNNTNVQFSEQFVFDRITTISNKIPNEIAVRVLGINVKEITYRELDERSNQVAHFLKSMQVGPDVLVGVFLKRDIELLISLLGIMKAGGAYIPLDPTYPPERLAYMLDDANIKIVITQEQILNHLPAGDRNVVCIDRDWSLMNGFPRSSLKIELKPEHLAYVIYTSGSTGKPKGAMIEHRGLTNYLNWCEYAYPLEKGRGSPVHSSISFDLTITSMYSPLISGKTVELIPEEMGIEGLTTALQNYGDFSLVKLTPAHLQLLGEQIKPSQAGKCASSFIIGGENLTTDHVRFWSNNAPESKLVNEYGPTETVVGCCVYTLNGEESIGVIPIGKPIANMKLYVLDEFLEPLPIGVPGELFIGGVGVGRGYLNRPELTAERFIPNPFSDKGKLYKTGDRARWLSNGNLECLGRLDDQVKVRGFRIELGEIEAVLSKVPGVKECVVWVHEEGSEQSVKTKRLVGYIVPGAEQQKPDHNSINNYLSKELPEYMLPSTYIIMERLPLTPNGKVDRKVLPKPHADLSKSTEFESPSTEKEKILAGIWAEVLGKEHIGVNDNFFELGGDSILTIQVVARAGNKGLRISARQMFEAQTIRRLAQVAEEGVSIIAEQGPVTGKVQLTPIQEWFFQQGFEEPWHWNQSLLLEVTKNLNIDHLRLAMKNVLEHHDALRMVFKQSISGVWEGEILGPEMDIPLSFVMLAGQNEEERVLALENQVEEIQSSLNLENGPVFRVVYFDFGEGKGGRLLIVVHHLVMDGVSWRILMEDILGAYTSAENGLPILLPLKTTSFKEWSARMNDYSRAPEVVQQLEFWSNSMNIHQPGIPVNNANGINSEASTEKVSFSLTNEETRILLQEIPSIFGTEINDILLTALAYAIHKWAGSNHALIALEGHGREEIFPDIDINRTIGWFTAIYPASIEVKQGSSVVELLKSVKEQLRAIPQKGLGYGLLKYINQTVGKVLKEMKEPQIIFNYLGQFDKIISDNPRFHLAKENSGSSRSLNSKRQYLLEVTGGVLSNCMNIEIAFSSNIHERKMIDEFSLKFQMALQELIKDRYSVQTNVYTPSDFNLAGLDQVNLDKIMKKVNRNK